MVLTNTLRVLKACASLLKALRSATHGALTAKLWWIMKFTTVLILAASLHVAAAGNAQRVTLSLRNVPLKTVFVELNRQTGYNFLYSDEVLAAANNVSIKVKDALLGEVLNLCFKGQPLDYVMQDNAIVVKPSPAVVFKPTESPDHSNLPPPIDITGKVTNEDGDPLVGANVKVKGTDQGTTTDVNGVFVLKGVDDNATLEISYVGYQSLNVPVGGKTSIVAALKVNVQDMNEVVINKGYYMEKQKYSVSNVGKVTAKDIEKQPVNNPLLALQGRIPGLVITQNTGVPGGGITVRIQGQNSILRGNDPLYVIDGVPINAQIPSTGLGDVLGNSGTYIVRNAVVGGVGNPLAFLNPDFIESIEVLKDADATAIYGSRAANGAILITTKKGKSGAAKVNFNIQNGWGDVSRKMEMLNTRQYLDMRYEALKYSNVVINAVTPTSSSYYDLKVWDTTRYTDWQKELIGGMAKYTNLNGTVSGGTENIQFMVGGTYHRETTVFPGDFSDQKASVHFNLTSSSTNRRFSFQFTGNYLFDDNQLPQGDLTEKAILLEPVAPPPFADDGSLNWQPNSAGTSTFNINPMASIMNIYRNKTNNLLGNMGLSYHILPGLNVKSSFGYSKTHGNEFVANPLSSVAPEVRPLVERSAKFGFKEMYSWIIEPQANYEKQFGNGRLNILIGSTLQQYGDNGYYIDAKGQANDKILENINAATTIEAKPQFNSTYKYTAAFAHIHYDWKRKFVVNLNARRDGSSRYGEKSRFHNFGSIGAGWIFTEETMLKNALPFLGFGKIRGNIGTSGNDLIGDYTYMSLYNSTISGVAYQGAAGLVSASIANPYLQWEETRKLSIGLDLGFFKDRLMLNCTFQSNRSSNQVLTYQLPVFTGYPNVIMNFPATVGNTSWEFQLSSVNINKKQFNWNTNLNLTIPKNKLVAFPNLENTSYATSYIVGEPLSIIQAFKFLGVNPGTGSYMALDKNGNPTASPDFNNDRKKMVNTSPRFYGGIQNSFSYNGIQFDFLFEIKKQISLNYYFGNRQATPGNFTRGQSNQPTLILDHWQKAGDLSSVRFYSLSSSPSDIITQISDASYTDGSYARLKNLSISYTLPRSWMQKMRMNTCRFYMQGQNLLTITNYTGLDPESQSLSSLPPLRVWTIGIQIGM